MSNSLVRECLNTQSKEKLKCYTAHLKPPNGVLEVLNGIVLQK